MGIEVATDLYSTDIAKRKEATYSILFERQHSLAKELKRAAEIEKNEDLAILMAQIYLTLESNPRNLSLERNIIELIQNHNFVSFSDEMWEYLLHSGSRQMLVSVIDAMDNKLPNVAHDFIENCMNHTDPIVRALACEIAIKSGRPTHFAHVLKLVTDKDILVSETAFRLINEISPENLAIMVESALGSSVDWVLENVAPFLPLLVNKELRPIMTKVMYHSNELVARKAREALKALDAKLRSQIKTINPKSSKKTNEIKTQQEELPPPKTIISIKEKMEKRRKQNELEQKAKVEEDFLLEQELSKHTESDAEEFQNDLESFETELTLTTGNEEIEKLEEDLKFVDNPNFENELQALENIEIGNEPIEIENEPIEIENEPIEIETEETTETKKEDIKPEQIKEKILISKKIKDSTPDIQPQSSSLLPKQASEGKVNENDISEVKNTELPEMIDLESGLEELTDETIELNVEDDIDIEIVSETDNNHRKNCQVSQIEQKEAAKSNNKAEKSITNNSNNKEKGSLISKSSKVTTSDISGFLSPAARTIINRYPSFISNPYSELFTSKKPSDHITTLNIAFKQITAFLNLCFLQSSMFYASSSKILSKTIKDCLKNHLTGSISLRHMHNFAMALKTSHANPSFYTFELANLMTESSEENPLLMMRELAEYLKEPIAPLEESVVQAIDGFTHILSSLKGILQNKLVMKAPKGAKKPFADLSGPRAEPLKKEDIPQLELPDGEIILISKDGSEALGLFPYFKYYKRKIVFAKPSIDEFKILLERLELEI